MSRWVLFLLLGFGLYGVSYLLRDEPTPERPKASEPKRPGQLQYESLPFWNADELGRSQELSPERPAQAPSLPSLPLKVDVGRLIAYTRPNTQDPRQLPIIHSPPTQKVSPDTLTAARKEARKYQARQMANQLGRDPQTPFELSAILQSLRLTDMDWEVPVELVDVARKTAAPGRTVEERAILLYQWISRNFEYYDYGQEPPITLCWVTRRGICGDYARIYAAMCRAVGIYAMVVIGSTPEGYHAWNRVYIPEKQRWIACDPTWEVPGGLKWFDVPYFDKYHRQFQ